MNKLKRAYIFGNYFFNEKSDGYTFCIVTNHYATITQIKFNNLKSLLPQMKITEFECSICKENFETCLHEEGHKYGEIVCQPIVSKGEPVGISSVPFHESSRITDMLLISSEEKDIQFAWYGFPKTKKKQRLKNIDTAFMNQWVSEQAAIHFRKAFSKVLNGIISFPPNPTLIIEQGYRFDFITEFKELGNSEKVMLEADTSDHSLYVKFKSRFDPERYNSITIDKIKYVYDKFDKILIPSKVTYEYLNRVTRERGADFYWIRPNKDNIQNYVADRIKEMEKSLKDSRQIYQFVDRSELFLSKIEDKMTMKFIILFIDIADSTKMSLELSHEKYAKIIEIYSREIASIVNNYHGYILKFVGDGIVIYFPNPPFWGMDDNALDCAVMMKFLIEHGINTAFAEFGLPSIKFRIGIDSGYSPVTTVGSETIKQHKDLLGSTVNIVTKIQSVAKENHILVGQELYKRLHTSRRKLFNKVKPKNWNYTLQNDNEIYPIYELKNAEMPN